MQAGEYRISRLLLFVFATFVFVIPRESINAEETVGSLRLERDILLVEANAAMEKFLAQYMAGLERLKTEAKQQGLPEKVAAVEDEMQNFDAPNRETNSRFPDLAALQRIYREKSAPIAEEMAKEKSKIFDWYADKVFVLSESYVAAGQLDKADEAKKERDATLLLALTESLSGSGSFVEEFNAPLSPVLWSWSKIVQFGDDEIFAIGADDSVLDLVLEKGLSGEFEVQVDFERDGEHVWQWFDLAVYFPELNVSAGVRLARDDENLVFLSPSPSRSGGPGNPAADDAIVERGRGRDTRKGTFIIRVRSGQLTAAFRETESNEITTDPLPLAGFEETKIGFILGGVPDTPRRIHRVSISREFSDKE